MSLPARLTGEIIYPEISDSCNLSPTPVAGRTTENESMLDMSASGHYLDVWGLLFPAVKSHVGHNFSEKEGNDSNPEKCTHPSPGRRREGVKGKGGERS